MTCGIKLVLQINVTYGQHTTSRQVSLVIKHRYELLENLHPVANLAL